MANEKRQRTVDEQIDRNLLLTALCVALSTALAALTCTAPFLGAASLLVAAAVGGGLFTALRHFLRLPDSTLEN